MPEVTEKVKTTKPEIAPERRQERPLVSSSVASSPSPASLLTTKSNGNSVSLRSPMPRAT